MTTVVGKGTAKGKGAIPVRGPSFTVVRVGESEAELGEEGGRRSHMGGGGCQTRWRGRDRGAKNA